MDMDGHNNSHQYIPDPTNLCRVSDPGLDLSDRKKMDLDSTPQKKSDPTLIINPTNICRKAQIRILVYIYKIEKMDPDPTLHKILIRPSRK